MFKTTKAKIIFVTFFSLICIIITTMLILYKNIEIEQVQEDTEEISKQSQKKDVNGIDLKGTYNQNDLEIEEKSISHGKVEIRYFQINGLKNKIIQEKINNEIFQAVNNCYKEQVTNLNEIINVQVSMREYANFSNAVSFEVVYNAKIDDNDDGLYQGFEYLNYDLNTGEKITIDKLFTSDAPIENILRKSVYYTFVINNAEFNLAGDLMVSDYGDIEDETAKIVNLYKKGKITEFYYTEKEIFIDYDEENTSYNQDYIVIDMKDFAEYIAIYNRYLSSESLFESNNIGMKNLYTLTKRYNEYFYYTNYQNEDRYFIDISIDFQSAEDDEFAKKIVDEKIAGIEREIEKIKQQVSENPNDFYVLNYYISIYTGEESSIQQIVTSCWEHGNVYKMTVHDFEENIEPRIIKYNREACEAGFVYDFSQMLKIEPQTTTEYYNPETGEKIVP